MIDNAEIDRRVLHVPWCGGRVAPYYADELVTLYHGDVRFLGPLLPLQTGRVHSLSDPPYTRHTHDKSRAGARKTTLTGGDGKLRPAAISRTVDFGFAPLSSALRHTLADLSALHVTGWNLTFCDVEGVAGWMDAVEEAGLEYVRTGTWIKVGATPQFTGDRPGVGAEAIVISHAMAKGKPTKKSWNGGGSHATWPCPIVLERGGADQEPRVHETQKPEALICKLIELFTNQGDLVIDWTAGSATTLVCARRLGRRAIGFEQRGLDCISGKERLEAERAGVSYHAARAGQVGMFQPQEAR